MNTVRHNFGIAVLSRLAVGGISLVIVGLLTRTLGPAGYGQYSLILAYLFVVMALADLGLYTFLVREISKTGADEKFIASNILSLRLVSVVGFLGLGVLVSLLLPYSGEIRLGILIAGIFAVFSSLVQVLTGVFQKYLKLYYVSLADVLGRGFQLLLVVMAARLGLGFLAFVWIVAVSELIHFLIVFVFARGLVKVGIELNFRYWGQTLKESLPIAVSLVFVLLYFKMDTVLLSVLKPAYDVGVYSAAYKVLETVIFLPAIYVGLLMPMLSRQAGENHQEFVKIFRRGFDALSVFALPAMAYLFLRADDIIRIVGGAQFGQSVVVLQILSIAIMLIFFGNLGGNALVALGLQKKGVGIYLAGAVFNIGANLILIPRYSFLAAAWTTVLTELLVTVGMFWLIKKQTQTTVSGKVFWRAALATLITVGVIHPLHLNLAFATIASLAYFPILALLGGAGRQVIREILQPQKTIPS